MNLFLFGIKVENNPFEFINHNTGSSRKNEDNHLVFPFVIRSCFQIVDDFIIFIRCLSLLTDFWKCRLIDDFQVNYGNELEDEMVGRKLKAIRQNPHKLGPRYRFLLFCVFPRVQRIIPNKDTCIFYTLSILAGVNFSTKLFKFKFERNQFNWKRVRSH